MDSEDVVVIQEAEPADADKKTINEKVDAVWATSVIQQPILKQSQQQVLNLSPIASTNSPVAAAATSSSKAGENSGGPPYPTNTVPPPPPPVKGKGSTVTGVGRAVRAASMPPWFREFDRGMGNVFGFILIMLAYVFILVTFPLSLFICLKVAQEYERIVIFRLGKLLAGGARGPGLFFILPCIDTYRKIDLRTVTYDVPPQELLSKDSVTVSVDAVVYFRTSNAIRSVTNVTDAFYSTKLLTQTTLRNVLGTKTLAEMLSDREQIAIQAQRVLDEGTDPWGIKVERMEVKDIRLPQSLTRAMAAEAEATREAKAKVIAAEGEHKASRALKEAASVLSECGTAIQLRYLQTLSNIAAEHNSTIVFPVPMNLFSREAS